MAQKYMSLPFDLVMAIGKVLSQLPAGQVGKIFVDLNDIVSKSIELEKGANVHSVNSQTQNIQDISDESGVRIGISEDVRG